MAKKKNNHLYKKMEAIMTAHPTWAVNRVMAEIWKEWCWNARISHVDLFFKELISEKTSLPKQSLMEGYYTKIKSTNENTRSWVEIYKNTIGYCGDVESPSYGTAFGWEIITEEQLRQQKGLQCINPLRFGLSKIQIQKYIQRMWEADNMCLKIELFPSKKKIYMVYEENEGNRYVFYQK